MSYGREPSSVLSVAAFVCAAAAFLGQGPMLAVVAMVCAALAAARGEGLAGAAALVSVVVLVLSFVLPMGAVLAATGT
jgi:hypothetical protein